MMAMTAFLPARLRQACGQRRRGAYGSRNESRLPGRGPLRSGSRQRTAGVTLIELAVVVLLLAIVSTIAIPRFANTLNSTSVKTAAQRIGRDITLVRSWARITSHSQSIAFDTVQNTYTMPGVPSADHSAGTNTVALSDGTLKATLASVSLGTGSTTLTFNGFGVPVGLPAGGGAIGVSAGPASSTILIDSITGFVTIQ
jgi:type II secretory pathway pseudopilin PulG